MRRLSPQVEKVSIIIEPISEQEISTRIRKVIKDGFYVSGRRVEEEAKLHLSVEDVLGRIKQEIKNWVI